MTNHRTPVFNWDKLDFEIQQNKVVTASDEEALQHLIIKAQQTARGVYLIYADTENDALNHKYGSDAFEIITQADLSDDARISELKRAIREAIIYDPWVVDVGDVEVYKETDKESKVVMWYADYTVKTIFDRDIDVKGVLLNG